MGETKILKTEKTQRCERDLEDLFSKIYKKG